MFEIVSSALALVITYWPPLLLATIVSYFYLGRNSKSNLPPGPTGWPIVGYIPILTDLAHLDFIELSKKYGNVIRVRLGMNECVILNDNASACEALGKDACLNRPEPSLFSLFGADTGITNWEGDLWKDHRRFALRTLRTLGVGKPEMENLISEEIAYLTSKLESHNGKPTPVRKFLAPSASNVVLAVLLGHRFDYDHPTRVLMDAIFSAESIPSLLFTGYVNNFVNVFKWLRKLPFTDGAKLKLSSDQFNQFFVDEIAEHLKTIDKNNPRDLMDHYFNECDDMKSPHFSKDKAQGICGDMLGAGSGTVKDSLEWALMMVTMHPDVQAEIHSEIDEHIGRERRPTYSDRANMPYTQAAIHESLRHGSLIPINLPHIASEDITIAGYNVPKGTHIYVNAYALHNDPDYWPNPKRFDPTRFLSEDRKHFVKKESFMPFGYGKRSCPGESLAQVELFLYLTNILQKFRIEASPGQKLTTDVRFVGFTMIPKIPLELVFKKR